MQLHLVRYSDRIMLWLGAADLKFLHWLPQAPVRNFRSNSGTRNIELLVPLCFRSSCQRAPQCITNFGNRALGHETQTIDRGDRRLDSPDAGPEPGARRRRAGFEEGRFSAAGLV